MCSAPGGIDAADVLDLLTALADKSFVVTVQAADGVRYRMLETIRAFAEEQLLSSEEDERLRRAHARVFLALAERADPQLRRRDQLTWMDRLLLEHDDLYACLRWTLETGHAPEAVRLVSALGWYWFLRGLSAEAAGWAAQALALPGDGAGGARAQALVMSGLAAPQDLVRSLDEAMRLVGELGAAEEIPPLLAMVEPMVYLLRGEPDEATRHIRGHLDGTDPWLRALARVTLGRINSGTGKPRSATVEHAAALAGFRELGERWGMTQALTATAELCADSGDHDAAIVALREALRYAEELRDIESRLSLTVRLAQSLARSDRLDQARSELDSAVEVAHRQGAREHAAFAHHALADVARWSDDLPEARRLLDSARAGFGRAGRGIGTVPPSLALSQAYCDLAAGDADAAGQRYREAADAVLSTSDGGTAARVAELAAHLAVADDQPVGAAEWIGRAEALRGTAVPVDPDGASVRARVRALLGERAYEPALRAGAAAGPRAALTMLGAAR